MRRPRAADFDRLGALACHRVAAFLYGCSAFGASTSSAAIMAIRTARSAPERYDVLPVKAVDGAVCHHSHNCQTPRVQSQQRWRPGPAHTPP